MGTYWVSLLVTLAVLALAASTDLESRVQNGQPIGPEHKHLVELNTHFEPYQPGEYVFSCTGSILNGYWIISAKHCLQRDGSSLNWAKIVRHMNSNTENTIVDYKLAPVIGPYRAQHDIALVKVANQLNTNVYQPILLSPVYPVQGSTAIVAGYGKPDPSLPRQGVVTIGKCNFAPICSFSNEFTARPDNGDSGGPLTVDGRLVGIISEGIPPTATNPLYEEHYVAIADHYNWIMGVIKT
ncbi:trypsin-7-like [Choristoneura fumiferana]|uniref:trypsin-7-like n=1 Tax=Choristoneura fumiferana TaxID=7141 RepID=UPI003D15C742